MSVRESTVYTNHNHVLYIDSVITLYHLIVA